MPRFKHSRKLGSIDFASNTKKTLPIDVGDVLLELVMRVQYTITNGATAQTTPLFQALARLVKRVEVVVGGRDTVISVSGAMLAARAEYERALSLYGMDQSINVANDGSTVVDIVIPISFFLPRSRRPDDTALDLRGINQAQLAVTWGSISDIFGTVNTASVGSVTCTVEAEYHAQAEVGKAYMVRSLEEDEHEVNATTPNMRMKLVRGAGLLMRSAFLVALDDDEGDNGVINALSLKAGSSTFYEGDGAILQARNKHWYSPANGVIAGCYALDTSVFGEGTDFINTGALGSDLEVVADVTKGAGTHKVIVAREYVRGLQL